MLQLTFISIFLMVFNFNTLFYNAPQNPDKTMSNISTQQFESANIVEDDQLVVKGRWNGKEVLILIDTGASGGGISSNLAATLTPIPDKKVHFAGATGAIIESDLYKVEGLEIAGKAIKPFEAYSRKKSNSTIYDISIGLPQLTSYVVEVNLKQNIFSLLDTNPYAEKEMYNLVCQEDDGSSPLVSAKVNNFTFKRMILDTGAGINCIEPKNLRKFRYKKVGTEKSVDVAGVVETDPIVKVKRICVYEVCNEEQTFLVSSLRTPGSSAIDGIIGVPFLKGKKLIIDIPRQKIKVFSE